MTRRLILAPAVVGVIATVEIARRAAWLAGPVFGTIRALCQRPQPTTHTEFDNPA